MEHSKQETVNRNAEISLKELLLKVGEWWRFLLSKWLVIGIWGIIGAGLGLTASLMQKDKYEGKLTFILEESNSGGLSTYAGLASQLGFDIGGASNNIGAFSGDNIMEFLKSRMMIQKTLLSPVAPGDKRSLADLYVSIYELDKNWSKDPAMKNVNFHVGQSREKYTLKQDSVLDQIYKRIVKTNLVIEKLDNKLDFIVVKTTTTNELFSKIFTECLVREATTFYIDTKTQRSKINVDKLQSVADSLKFLLNRQTYSVASSQDPNMNPARLIAGVNTELQTRDKVVLQTMYTEVIKNLEISKMTMVQETPIMQIVDKPILPLEIKHLGKLKGMIIGGFILSFLAVLIIFTRLLLKGVMNG